MIELKGVLKSELGREVNSPCLCTLSESASWSAMLPPTCMPNLLYRAHQSHVELHASNDLYRCISLKGWQRLSGLTVSMCCCSGTVQQYAMQSQSNRCQQASLSSRLEYALISFFFLALHLKLRAAPSHLQLTWSVLAALQSVELSDVIRLGSLTTVGRSSSEASSISACPASNSDIDSSSSRRPVLLTYWQLKPQSQLH